MIVADGCFALKPKLFQVHSPSKNTSERRKRREQHQALAERAAREALKVARFRASLSLQRVHSLSLL